MTKAFQRFAREEELSEADVIDAIVRTESGLIAANLGSGVIKQRIARQGSGKSGGHRTILLFVKDHRAVFLYGFSKNEQENVSKLELTALRESA